jgi:hypothetical protein
METLKYLATTIGVVFSAVLIAFTACFVVWLFEKWRNER